MFFLQLLIAPPTYIILIMFVLAHVSLVYLEMISENADSASFTRLDTVFRKLKLLSLNEKNDEAALFSFSLSSEESLNTKLVIIFLYQQ